MRLAILSRNPNLYSVKRLLQEAQALDIDYQVVNPTECQLLMEPESVRVLEKGKDLPTFDLILPRIGPSITDYGLCVVKHFEIQGVFSVNSSCAIADSRNKMRCLQLLTQAKIHVPRTMLSRSSRGLAAAVKAARGFPIVLKVLQGTQGLGVMLVHTPISLGSVLETLRSLHQDVLIQQFVHEGAGKDYRAFVVGGKVVASMMRTAPVGEFRANMHLGAAAGAVHLPREYQLVAVQAARVLGLEVAGVDILESNQGPMVIEVNSSPGFEGVEKATKINVARTIISHVKKLALAQKKKKMTARTQASRMLLLAVFILGLGQRAAQASQKTAEAELLQLKQAQGLGHAVREKQTGQNGVGSENFAYISACLKAPATRSLFLVKRESKVKGPFPTLKTLYGDLSRVLGRI